eukprot:CAMPEP_0175100024 /NCGR_PEP_ID=MMETSP0086_2-20121207/6811_1 /TAXON_ID=136419 /ORGANISM="Unknown Unknown, Strain D1" /LENGTH=516 /DNA_ID=CAMNT_0016373997 /DNA_START=158 /DNA_END=1708 /DNA_ORIENTATION=+
MQPAFVFTALLFLAGANAQRCNAVNARTATLPGFSNVCLTAANCFLIYSPATSLSPSSPGVPLVIDFHATGVCGSNSASYTGWRELADREGIVVAFPQATDGQGFWSGGAGDVEFSRAVINWALQSNSTTKVDGSRVYLAGHSSGCFMAQAVAVKASDIVAGVACHSLFLTHEPTTTYRAVPAMEIHGTADSVPYSGAVANFQRWGKINRCQDTPQVRSFPGGDIRTYQKCEDQTEVALVSVNGGGHNVYSVRGPHDTTQIAWEFLRRFRRTNGRSALLNDSAAQISTNLPVNLAPEVMAVPSAMEVPQATTTTADVMAIPTLANPVVQTPAVTITVPQKSCQEPTIKLPFGMTCSMVTSIRPCDHQIGNWGIVPMGTKLEDVCPCSCTRSVYIPPLPTSPTSSNFGLSQPWQPQAGLWGQGFSRPAQFYGAPSSGAWPQPQSVTSTFPASSMQYLQQPQSVGNWGGQFGTDIAPMANAGFTNTGSRFREVPFFGSSRFNLGQSSFFSAPVNSNRL